MAFLFTKKNRTHDAQTRIVKHEGESHTEASMKRVAVPAYVTSTLRDWRKGEEDFTGFDSPPGRF